MVSRYEGERYCPDIAPHRSCKLGGDHRSGLTTTPPSGHIWPFIGDARVQLKRNSHRLTPQLGIMTGLGAQTSVTVDSLNHDQRTMQQGIEHMRVKPCTSSFKA